MLEWVLTHIPALLKTSIEAGNLLRGTWVFIYSVITCLFIIWAGVREASTEDESMRSKYANAATAALIVQAVVFVAVWG
jgi:hypothetical protein